MKRTILFLVPLLLCAPLQANELDKEYFDLAETFKKEKLLEKAIANYKQALRINPAYFQACFNLAGALYDNNAPEDAVTYYKKSIELRPDCAEAHHNLGVALNRLSKVDEALEEFAYAIKHNNKYIKAYQQRGTLLQKKGKHEEAIEAFNQVITHSPNNFDAHLTLGRLYRDQNRFDEAVNHFRKAKAVEPNNTGALLELANTLNMFENTGHECLELYQRALELNPNLLVALYNFGYTLKKIGRVKEAIQVYDKVLAQVPEYELARFSRAVSYLMLGDFEHGWPEYEWRWKAYNEKQNSFKEPIWEGQDIQGKRIFVSCEQGLGDSLQFLRYLKLLKDRGAYVLFQAQSPLKTLLKGCSYIDRLLSSGEIMPSFDYHIALLSLPMVFKTTLTTVPASIPYLEADQKLVEYWREQLSKDKNFKIGLCWQGNANYRTQFLRQTVAAKSMQASNFAPLAKIPGVSLYSLQKIGGQDQIEKTDFTIHDFGADFDNSHGRFMDTAAVMKNLDLVITIDTSICHLAGGLGVPVWNLLPTPADWRWMLDRNDTPWYPQMRLFRQPKPGDWASVMQTVAQEVEALIKTRQASAAAKAEFIPPRPPELNAKAGSSVEGADRPATTTVVRSDVPINNQPSAASATPHSATSQLLQQLSTVNKELMLIEEQLHAKKHSVHTQEFADLARRAYYTFNKKQYILRQLERTAPITS